MVASATMLSRVLGLVREQLFAALLGASMFADAFLVAFRIPNLLRDLFAEGALAQAFVPTFKATLKHHGRTPAFVLANRVAGSLLATLGMIVLIAGICAPWIVDAIAGTFADHGGSNDKFDLTVLLTRIMLPFLPIVSLAAVAMGMLNAQDKYTTPALAPAVFNITSIVVGSVLYWSGASGQAVAIGWSIGTILGGLAQLGIQIPALWQMDYRPRIKTDLRLRDPGVRKVGKLMLPAVGGLAAVQVNIFVNTIFASTEPGAVAWLNYAFRFLQLPIGVFGVAIATVTTTRFSDAAADQDRPAMGKQLAESLRLAIFLTVPATVGLWVLGEPIIRLIFEHGRFEASDTIATVRALHWFIVGLVAYACVKVTAPGFYAMNLARIPVFASIVAVAGNLLLNVILHPTYGYAILALGTAAAAVLNFAILYLLFHRRIQVLPHLEIFQHGMRIVFASGVMGIAVWQCNYWIEHALGTQRLFAQVAGTIGPILVGVTIYCTMCAILRIQELHPFLKRLRK